MAAEAPRRDAARGVRGDRVGRHAGGAAVTGRMPDFAMPSREELDAERAAAADAATERTAERGVADGGEPRAPIADAEPAAPERGVPHAHPRPRRAALRGRAGALVRNPVAAFVAGGALVAAASLAVPAVAESAAQASAAELDDTFDAYVEAVRAGDAEAATAAWMPSGAEAGVELLEAGAAPDAPPEVDCSEPTVDGDRATAACEVLVEGWGYSSTGVSLIVLDRGDDGWRVTTGLAEIASLATSAVGLTSVAGVAVEGVEPLQWLLPGGYGVEWAPAPLFEVEEGGGLVVQQGGGYVQLDVQLGPELRDAAAATALAFVDACLVDAATAASCSLEVPEVRSPLTATVDPGYGSAATSYVAPVRIGGLDDLDPATLEVEVTFADDGTTWTMAVRSVQRWGQP